MGCQGCSRCYRRQDSNASDNLEGADGSLVGEQEHEQEQEHEPPLVEDNNEERQEQHYEAPMALPPEHHYSR